MCTRRFDRSMWLSYIYWIFLCTTIRPRLRVLTYLIFLYAHNHLIKTCGPLQFIITFQHDHSTKVIRVLIYTFISFVHDYSTKIRGHSYSLIYLLINCVNVSYATFMAVLIYSVHCIHGGTAVIFRTLCPWLYEVLVERTLDLCAAYGSCPVFCMAFCIDFDWKRPIR